MSTLDFSNYEDVNISNTYLPFYLKSEEYVIEIVKLQKVFSSIMAMLQQIIKLFQSEQILISNSNKQSKNAIFSNKKMVDPNKTLSFDSDERGYKGCNTSY